jgi:hypothetical protein
VSPAVTYYHNFVLVSSPTFLLNKKIADHEHIGNVKICRVINGTEQHCHRSQNVGKENKAKESQFMNNLSGMFRVGPCFYQYFVPIYE